MYRRFNPHIICIQIHGAIRFDSGTSVTPSGALSSETGGVDLQEIGGGRAHMVAEEGAFGAAGPFGKKSEKVPLFNDLHHSGIRQCTDIRFLVTGSPSCSVHGMHWITSVHVHM